MLYRTTVVGGEILSPRMDGFVHGLIDLSSDGQHTSETETLTRIPSS